MLDLLCLRSSKDSVAVGDVGDIGGETTERRGLAPACSSTTFTPMKLPPRPFNPPYPLLPLLLQLLPLLLLPLLLLLQLLLLPLLLRLLGLVPLVESQFQLDVDRRWDL